MDNNDKEFADITDIRILLRESKLRRIMTEQVISINKNEPFVEVPKKMAEYHIRHLPVVDDSNKLVGLMTPKGAL
ncbi:MAG: CBS domain-containing protein [Candidatus Zapsychrus exili]|nr:CBS domain-containing protein [Candidatus Zapsychrus exili]